MPRNILEWQTMCAETSTWVNGSLIPVFLCRNYFRYAYVKEEILFRVLLTLVNIYQLTTHTNRNKKKNTHIQKLSVDLFTYSMVDLNVYTLL